jgi:hypothetical protein
MARKDVNLRESGFAALVFLVRVAERERQEAISAGRIHDADRYFREYATRRLRGEQLARELGYQDYDVAAKNVAPRSLQ